MFDELCNVIKTRDIVIPRLLFDNFKKIDITNDELLVLVYLINTNGRLNPKELASIFDIKLPNILELISSLVEKELLKVNIVDINGIKEEVYDLTSMYKKLSFIVINSGAESVSETSNIFSVFEQEFARTLSPMEYELIRGWLDYGYSENLILAALKEAVFNGVNNLRYIDKILYEWNKKGIKDAKDIKKNNFRSRGNSISKSDLEYDWLHDGNS